LQVPAPENFDTNSLLLEVLVFLNERNIKYRATRFSSSCDETEIERELARLGMGLLEGVPVEIVRQGLFLAIIPAALGLHSDSLKELFAPREARLLTSAEFLQRFPFKPAKLSICLTRIFWKSWQ
jgi:hypothetical protein